MATPISFALYDVGGLPLTSAVPTFVYYVSKTGVAQTPPTIFNLGGGQYGFTPADADELAGVCYVIDGTVAALQRYPYGSISLDSNPFALFVVFDAAGNLTVGAPTVGRYTNFAGVVQASPTVTMVGALTSLYTITPSVADLQSGVVFRLDAFAGTFPAYLSGFFTLTGLPATGVVTLLDVRTLCKQESDNVGQSFLSDPEWDAYIRSSYKELYGLIVQAFGNDYFVQSPYTGYTFVTDGLNQFFDLPPDFFKMLGVDLQTTQANNWVALRPFAFADRNRMAINGNPTPTAGQTVRLLYVPRLQVPLADADPIDGVNGWEEYIVIDACMKAWAKEETDISSFVMRKQAIIDRLNSEIENRDAGSPAAIVDVLGKRARAMQYRINGNKLWLIGSGIPGYPYEGGDWAADTGLFGWY